MANRITWLPSTDANISKYDVYSGPTNLGVWTALSTINHVVPGPDYAAGYFFYVDSLGTNVSWYRIDAVDSSAQTGTLVFQVTSPNATMMPGNKVTWQPSIDTSITLYNIERGNTINGPWSLIANVSNSAASGFYNSDVSKFVYPDPSGSESAWYRVTSVNNIGQTRSSPPFQTSVLPYFVPGSTPFGVYDNDPQFVGDADNMVDFVKRKLGEPVMTVHMGSSQIYGAFEEACLEYSAMVNSYQAKSVLTNYLGSPTGSLTGGENKYVSKNLQFELYQADAYAAEANLNSNQPWHTGSITLNPGQQMYDLPSLMSGTGPLTGAYDRARIRIRDIYHKSPMSPYRMFGTTSGLNYLNNQFRFESFTPETMFYLLPVWEDILRGMQFKTSNNVRRSNYSFDLHGGNQLRVFPTPSDTRQLWLTYTIDTTPINPTNGGPAPSATLPSYNAVSNLSNIPFGNIPYSGINSMSKHWIRRMTLAFAKEIEGQIRSKFSTVPIPNGDVTLNGPELIADGRAEQEILRGELKELLEETTYQSLMRKEQEMASYLNDALKNVPLGIYIG